MKKLFLTMALALAASAALAAISNVAVSTDATTGEVTVTYDISEPAVVTMAVASRGVPLAESKVTMLAGAVNRLVAATTGAEIRWDAVKECPEIGSGALTVTLTAWPADNPPDYMVADLRLANTVRYYVSTNAFPRGLADSYYRTSGLVMRKIPAKNVRWLIGSPSDRKTNDGKTALHGSNEPQYWVTFSDNYYVGIYELTVAQAKAIGFSPVQAVNFNTLSNAVVEAGLDRSYDFPACCNLFQVRGTATSVDSGVMSDSPLATLRTRTGVDFDVPTDAQWEFACRAGCSGPVFTGRGIASQYSDPDLGNYAWFGYNGGVKAQCYRPVGMKRPNAWGLYDTLGNVSEWTRDCYADTPYAAGSEVTDPTGTGTNKDKRCCRGGYWGNNPNNIRADVRSSYTATTGSHKNYTGVRLYCPAVAK